MSDETLYERYKDALKRGHVASLRGELEDALTAYAEAAAMAPDRSTPHTSAGTALLRHRRPAVALRHFAAAIQLSGNDEVALQGRADALAALRRWPEAADAFDGLADKLAAAGRVAEAVDAARRGLELAEGRDRRRTLARLVARLRASEAGEPGRVALERALQALEGTPLATPARGHRSGARPAGTGPAGDRAAGEPATGEAPAGGASATLADEQPAPEGEPAGTTPEAPAAAPYRRALDRDLDPGASAASLALLAEAAIDAGDAGVALDRLLDLASAHRREGHVDSALDACYLALSIAPDDAVLHLALVELYDERGWATLADEKLDLVQALAALAGGPEAVELVAAARSDRA